MTITQGFAPGIAAGGGLIPTPQLRMAVETAAEALADLYDGADVQIRFDSNGRSGGAFLITHPADHFMGNSEVGISASLTPAPLDDIVYSAHLTATAARHGHRIPGDSVTVECLDAALSLLREKANLDAAALKQTIAAQLRDYEAKHVCLGLAVPSRRDDPAYLILAENTVEGREYLERVQRSRSRLGALFSSYVAPARVVIDGAWAEFAPGTPFRVSLRVQWDDAVTPRSGVVFEVRNGSAVAIGEIKARSRS